MESLLVTSRPRLGSVAWERAGGPSLSFGEKAGMLAGAGVVLASHFAGLLRWKLGRWGISSVSVEEFGAEAHFMRAGGMVEVLAQDWKLHPKDLSDLLARHPRRGFADDVLPHIAREVARNPGCRFASLSPLLPWLVRRSKFSVE